jgi:Zn-dependent peptidase ImmA (M78 family)
LEGRVSADDLLEIFEVRTPPVDVEAIARGLGVAVQYVPNPGWSGAVSSTDAEAGMWISAEDAAVRQRFTLAHELGHLLLHQVGHAYRDRDYEPGTSRVELEANRFAAELLMPAWMVRAAMASTRGDTSRLARLFDVSEAAMRFRLSNLGLA